MQSKDTNLINKILEYHQLALADGKKYKNHRFLYYQLLKNNGKHFTGIIGPRGAGKTILLKQLALNQTDSIYISLDTLPDDLSIFDLVKELSQKYKIKYFYLDEVHYFKDINQELKKIYDMLDVKLFFTSSIALDMQKSKQDLSRRIQLIELPIFSFREYLYFKENIKLAPLKFDQIINQTWDITYLKYSYLFESYLTGGMMPFGLNEPNIFPLLENILNTIIQKDIPKVMELKVDELVIIKKLVAFIGNSSIDGINYSTISNNLGITKYKAEQYVTILTHSFILFQVFPKGTNVLKEPKILMQLPYRLLYKPYQDTIGGIREDFVVSALMNQNFQINYLKSNRGEKTPDFLINYNNAAIVVEVGGKGKGRTQFKGIACEKKLIFTHSNEIDELKRPLFLLGFL